MQKFSLSPLERLEAESIHILREVASEFERPLLLYSVGKDSSVLLHLAQKAFAPAKNPFPLLHVDTGYKFPEMISFRDRRVAELGLELRVFRNEAAIAAGTHPSQKGTQSCCALLKTEALLQALKEYGADAAIGGARRDEEKSRAKERIYSFRDRAGQWDPRNQRPEIWQLYNGRVHPGESMRIFPLSNWTEVDIWRYIEHEAIPVVPLYFAQPRRMLVHGGQLLPTEDGGELVMSRFRTLGCSPCTGAIRSSAQTVRDIVLEMEATRVSERATRVIDHDAEASMETKKREGYF